MTQRRFKLTVVGPMMAALLLAVVFGLVLVFSLWAVEKGAQQALRVGSRPMISSAAKSLFNPLYTLDVYVIDDILDQYVDGQSVVYAAVRDRTGQIITEAGEGLMDEQSARQLAARALAQGDLVERSTGSHLLLYKPIAVGSERIGTVEFAFARAPVRSSLRASQITISVTILVAFAGTVLAVTTIARFVTEPLGELVSVAEKIGAGDLDVPVRIRGTAEIAALATMMEHMKGQLQEQVAHLSDRTHDLGRRADQLQAAAEVAGVVTAILDLDELLPRVVDLISERFGFYHTSIYMFDPTKEWVVLRAASSQGGRRLQAQGYRLRVGQQGIVGHVASSGAFRVVLDVNSDMQYVHHPFLSETKSEMTLPLQARGQIVGVLDVQSRQINAFESDEVTILQTLANQVAMAISNTQLFTESQERLQVVQRAYGEYDYEAWAKIAREHELGMGYRYHAQQISSAESVWRSEMALAVEQNQTVADALSLHDAPLGAAAVPIRIRDQIVGVINARKHQGAGTWSPEEIGLLELLIDRLGQALDSARLHQDSQQRAVSQQISAEITNRMRQSLDVETVLKTAADEMYQVLDLDEIVIRLATPDAGDVREEQ